MVSAVVLFEILSIPCRVAMAMKILDHSMYDKDDYQRRGNDSAKVC